MTNLEILEFADSNSLTEQLLKDLLEYIAKQVKNGKEVHVALTGGRSGTQIAKELFTHLNDSNGLVHIWWSDERFLPSGDPERNDSSIPKDFSGKAKLHPLPSSSESLDLEEAVAKAQAELHLHTTTRFCDRNVLMDICLLSIGPDGHVASLFPNSESLENRSGIIAIENSPKPPSKRISWTFETINASEQVWLIATGSEKADVVTKLLQGSSSKEIPASGVHGKIKTVLYAEKSVLPN